jgi:3-deoxy-D-manno-octulosonic-acid transferase
MIAPCLGAMAPAARVLASPHERPLWSERLGRVALPGGAHAWVHSASLGEASAVGPLVRELECFQPGARLWLTANTRTGRERLQALERPASLAPIDSPQAVRRFFAGVRPERLFVIETEIWPHWLLHAAREGVPVAFVSARLSERSVRRYRELGAPLRRLVANLAAVLCQTEEDRERWLALGARPQRTEVTGNLKHDAVVLRDVGPKVARVELELERERPLLVLGSVRPGEVRLLARAFQRLDPALQRAWQVAVIPRHARATAELREEAARAGVTDAGGGEGWRWDDRSGVLNAYYAGADVAFVGGSLLPYGGHNPMEPAACGAAVLMGGHHASQAESVAALETAGGITLARTEDELDAALAALLGDAALRARRGQAARAVVEARRGAARRTLKRLVAWNLWPAA